MARKDPTLNRNSPIITRAFWNALQQAATPTDDVAARQGQYGKRWLINGRQLVTTTESALYLYIENPTDDRQLNVEGVDLYVDQSVTIDLYDEPTLDETTFNADEFKNTRSSVTKDPPWNLYRGVETDVTISDEGRKFVGTFADPGSKKDIGADHRAPGYIIDSNSSALIKIGIDSTNDTNIALNSYCHEEVRGPNLTDLEGTN